MAARRAAAAPARPRKPRRTKQDPASRGLDVAAVSSGTPSLAPLVAQVQEDGGVVLGQYAEPFSGKGVVLAALPIEQVEPTPFQRDRSETHVKKLAGAIERVERYLDPLICVRHGSRAYWTPNGNHRLGAMRLLGMKSIVALVLPEPEVAYQILALNTEKAHNLKERSLEVIRMYRGLVEARQGPETELAALFEEPHFATLGAAYEQRPRYSAGAYAPVVKRLESFLDLPLGEALAEREARAKALLAWDDEVIRVVDALKARGLTSPYLKTYVVARSNFLRFKKDTTGLPFAPTIDKLKAATRKIDPAGVTKDDVAKVGGVGPPPEEE